MPEEVFKRLFEFCINRPCAPSQMVGKVFELTGSGMEWVIVVCKRFGVIQIDILSSLTMHLPHAIMCLIRLVHHLAIDSVIGIRIVRHLLGVG